MEHEADSLNALNDSLSAAIQKECRGKDKKRSTDKNVIRIDWSGVVKPSSPTAFKPPFHFPPHRQYRTGTCWCFSTTSFFESEIKRLSGREIKLSEMHTVYWEYVEKALGYIAKRGCQPFAQGSESDAVCIIWKKYGVVPYAPYSGLPPGTDKYDEGDMFTEMSRYLEFAKEHNYWDEGIVIGQIRAILDTYMGRPPEEFEYQGARYTPKQFFDKVVKLNVDDYVDVMSTLTVPFYTKGKYDVSDNWRPTEDYMNVPLDEFYECPTRAAGRGYTVAIGGDVSEPGYYGLGECGDRADVRYSPGVHRSGLARVQVRQSDHAGRPRRTSPRHDEGRGPRLVPHQGFGGQLPLGEGKGLFLLPRRLHQAQDALLYGPQGRRAVHHAEVRGAGEGGAGGREKAVTDPHWGTKPSSCFSSETRGARSIPFAPDTDLNTIVSFQTAW